MEAELVELVIGMLPLCFFAYTLCAGHGAWRRLTSTYLTSMAPKDRASVLRIVVGSLPFATQWCRVDVRVLGLVISPTYQFRLLRRPVFIPWSDLRGRPTQTRWRKGVELVSKRVPEVRLKIPEPAAVAILAELMSRGQIDLSA